MGWRVSRFEQGEEGDETVLRVYDEAVFSCSPRLRNLPPPLPRGNTHIHRGPAAEELPTSG